MVVELNQELETSFGVKRLKIAYQQLVDGINDFENFDPTATPPVTTDPATNLELVINNVEPYIRRSAPDARPDHEIMIGTDPKISINSVTASILSDLAHIFKRMHTYDTDPTVADATTVPPVRDDLDVICETYLAMNADVDKFFRDPTAVPPRVNEQITDFVDELSLTIAERTGIEGYDSRVLLRASDHIKDRLTAKREANHSQTENALVAATLAYDKNPIPGNKAALVSAYEARAVDVNSIGKNNAYSGIEADPLTNGIYQDFKAGVDRFKHGFETHAPAGVPVTDTAKARFEAVVTSLGVPASTEQENMKIEAFNYLAKISKSIEQDMPQALANLDLALGVKHNKESYQLRAQYTQLMR